MSNKRLILAGGCFWGMEDLFRKQSGVISTRVGYTGGITANPIYADVKNGDTGHAEAIEVVYTTGETSLRALLEFFFQMHDPTTKDRQGNDIGSQYRSAIFYEDEEQKITAQALISEIDDEGFLPGKIVTEVVPASAFYEAEDFHQDYLEKNPGGYTCHSVRHHWALREQKAS